MFGNCATGNCTIATIPRITMMIEITMATIGRSTKKRDISAQAALAGATVGDGRIIPGASPAFAGTTFTGMPARI